MYPSRFLRINTQTQVAYIIAYRASREKAHMIGLAIIERMDKLAIPYKKRKRGYFTESHNDIVSSSFRGGDSLSPRVQSRLLPMPHAQSSPRISFDITFRVATRWAGMEYDRTDNERGAVMLVIGHHGMPISKALSGYTVREGTNYHL
jgi:hypothetical protein